MAILLIQITVIEKKILCFNKNVYHCFDFWGYFKTVFE